MLFHDILNLILKKFEQLKVKKLIDSYIAKTIDIFNNNHIYHIPDFQRDFVWGEAEVRQLFEDFAEDTNNYKNEIKNSDGYLLGNVVLINDQNYVDKKIVIDGQQRLTTLSLIYKALEKVLSEKRDLTDPSNSLKWAQKSADLAKGYGIINDEDSFEDLKIQHHSSLNFGNSYKSIIQGSVKLEENLENPSDTRINEVYETIEEEIRNFDEIQLSKFVTYIKSKVLLIITTAPDLSKAFQLFEILNNRGKSLDPIDLIKNSLLKYLTSSPITNIERETFNLEWKSFIKNLRVSEKRSIDSSTFLKHYLIGTQGLNVNKDKLFLTLSDPQKKYTLTEVLDLVKSLNRNSRVYGYIEQKNYKKFIKDTNKMYILFELLNLKQAHTLLMPFYFESEKIKEIAVDLAIRLGASVVFSFTQTNFIEAHAPNIIEKYYRIKKENDVDVAFNIFQQEIKKLIEERSYIAKEAISFRKFENRNGVANKKGLDLFKFIELYAHGNTQIINPLQAKKISLEHIMPRDSKFNDFINTNFSSEDERKEFLNRIGNFAILYNGDNSHLSNKPFFDKKLVYSNLSFLTTKSLGGNLETHIIKGKDTLLFNQINDYIALNNEHANSCKYWTKEMIEDRSEKVANYLFHILTAFTIPTLKIEHVSSRKLQNNTSENVSVEGTENKILNRADFHEKCINNISKKWSVDLIKKSKIFYISSNDNRRIVCVVSKRYPRKNSVRYWYAFHPAYMEFFEESQESYIIFGCGSADHIITIPYNTFSKYMYGLRETTKKNKKYWHVEIIQLENRFYLYLSKTKENIDVTKFLLS